MKNVAFIPVRGGSKSIPFKNIKMICGRPLVYWVLKAAEECKEIDTVVVSTDSEEIKNVVNGFDFDKVVVVDRSENTATDTASTESAMLEFASKYEFDNIVLIQATSPMLSCDDLSNGFLVYNRKGVDSVLSVVRQKRFVWLQNDDGYARALNYNPYYRPRRQEFDGFFVENGAFYITTRDGLLNSKNRISGNVAIYEMPEITYFEIDELSDWKIIEGLMNVRKMREKELPRIKLFLTDCDGCLTDGGMYYSEKNDELKKFNTRDGMGFKLLKDHGILTGLITGENVELNKRRAEKLQLNVYVQGCQNKLVEIKRIAARYRVELSDICYIGDDINDIEALKEVGFACCPNDAIDSVKEVSDYIANKNGGEGVIREVVDYLLGVGL